jgi:hypothetical protein
MLKAHRSYTSARPVSADREAHGTKIAAISSMVRLISWIGPAARHRRRDVALANHCIQVRLVSVARRLSISTVGPSAAGSTARRALHAACPGLNRPSSSTMPSAGLLFFSQRAGTHGVHAGLAASSAASVSVRSARVVGHVDISNKKGRPFGAALYGVSGQSASDGRLLLHQLGARLRQCQAGGSLVLWL